MFTHTHTTFLKGHCQALFLERRLVFLETFDASSIDEIEKNDIREKLATLKLSCNNYSKNTQTILTAVKDNSEIEKYTKPKNKIKVVQEVVGVNPDGIVGKITTGAINNIPEGGGASTRSLTNEPSIIEPKFSPISRFNKSEIKNVSNRLLGANNLNQKIKYLKNSLNGNIYNFRFTNSRELDSIAYHLLIANKIENTPENFKTARNFIIANEKGSYFFTQDYDEIPNFDESKIFTS